MALGAFATLTAELVHTGVELAGRDTKVAQLRQALTSRVIPQGSAHAPEVAGPQEPFGQPTAAGTKKMYQLLRSCPRVARART